MQRCEGSICSGAVLAMLATAVEMHWIVDIDVYVDLAVVYSTAVSGKYFM